LRLGEERSKERRLQRLGDAIAAYEAEFGVITADEIARQQHIDRASARIVRPPIRSAGRPRRRRRRTT
jgi:hypothetical protein